MEWKGIHRPCKFVLILANQALLDLLLTHGHSAIGPEIRRELIAGRGRGVPVEPQGQVFDGDDTMQVD